MINEIVEHLRDKKVAILGFGLEGKSTLNFYLKHLPDQKVTIIDRSLDITKVDNPNVYYILGDDYLDFLNDFDIVIKTPGISIIGRDYKCEVTSEFALLLQYTDSFTIAVTGTKGKSTTTSLIYNIIKDQYSNTFLVGNIGVPIFDLIEEFNAKSIIVAEASAHQLYDIRKSPNIGIITNFYEEHLDYFHDIDNYYNSKLNIFKYQEERDYAIYLEDNLELSSRVNKMHLVSHKIPLGKKNIVNEKVVLDDEVVFDLAKDKRLFGFFNDLNIMMALQVARILQLEPISVAQSIRRFVGLDHRMKLVKTVNERSFYDDTLATIPAATLNSIEAIPNVTTLIVGGMDRNINYGEFIEKLKETKLKTIICQPDTGKLFYDILKKESDKNILYIEDMATAVKRAYDLTGEKESILLSPAAPSYNIYKNYEEKSAHYIKLINELK